MAKQQRILSCLLFSSLLCSALVTSDEATRPTPVTIMKSVRGWTQRGSDGVKIEPSTDYAPATSNHPMRTPVVHMEVRSPSAEACAVTAAPILNLYRRQVNDQAVTIVFLSSALASAHGNAVSLSQSLASSISQLQLSIDFLSSSASSAIRSLQASASRAIQAVEASASDGVEAAEESAASRVSEVLSSATFITATGTGISSNRTAYQVSERDIMEDCHLLTETGSNPCNKPRAFGPSGGGSRCCGSFRCWICAHFRPGILRVRSPPQGKATRRGGATGAEAQRGRGGRQRGTGPGDRELHCERISQSN